MSRRDVEFDAEGVTLRGWFFSAENAKGSAPVIVMAHGFAAVKEMYLDKYAEAFSAAGLNVLVFDNRNFGASDGEFRQEIDPIQQVRDYRHAITYAVEQKGVDPERVGVWGSSYSGGHVLVVAAIDRRVRAVVSQVPMVSGHKTLARLVRSDFMDGLRAQFGADRKARGRGEAPAMLPVVDEDPMGSAALPTPDSYAWFTGAAEKHAPQWRNEVTLRTVEMMSEYEPEAYLPYIAPTPLLMLVAENDVLCQTDLELAAFEKASQPKDLVVLPGGHFDAYVDGFEHSMPPARDWFVKHLV